MPAKVLTVNGIKKPNLYVSYQYSALDPEE